jgi:4-hydroxybenzoate polyprenyltransferase
MIVWLKAIRIHQWVKNVLIFIPLLTSHNFFDPSKVFITLICFISFCFCSSAGYLINDCLDIQSDKSHPISKARPIAQGIINRSLALFVSFIFVLFGLLIAGMYSKKLIVFLIVYLIISISYSIKIKKYVLADVFCLSFLYLFRVLTGLIVPSITFSSWLLAFSLFFFLSLAFLKRYSELQLSANNGEKSIQGRGYLMSDSPFISQMGITSGYLSILIFAMYINSTAITSLYLHPHLMWFICPLLLIWISRYWFLAYRGHIQCDPILFVLKDKANYFILISIFFILILATIPFSI